MKFSNGHTKFHDDSFCVFDFYKCRIAMYLSSEVTEFRYRWKSFPCSVTSIILNLNDKKYVSLVVFMWIINIQIDQFSWSKANKKDLLKIFVLMNFNKTVFKIKYNRFIIRLFGFKNFSVPLKILQFNENCSIKNDKTQSYQQIVIEID